MLAGLETGGDAEVGAFVRLIQEAPELRKMPLLDESAHPLQGGLKTGASSEMSLQAGLDQLALLRLQISQMPSQSGISAMKPESVHTE